MRSAPFVAVERASPQCEREGPREPRAPIQKTRHRSAGDSVDAPGRRRAKASGTRMSDPTTSRISASVDGGMSASVRRVATNEVA
jgi:hypothetical protein